MNNIEVVGLGALNLDRVYRVERTLGDAETAAGRDMEHIPEAERKFIGSFPGGSAANTIYGLARLGVNTGFIGAVGDDDESRILLRDFEKAGVDTSQIKIKPATGTGETLCLVDNLNFRSIQVTPGANSLLNAGDIELDYLNRAGLLHISSFVDDPQLDIIVQLVARLDSRVKVSFSPGSLYAARGLQTLTPLLARADILFLNESEMKQLTGAVDFSSGARRCIELGCRIVAVTLGQGIPYKSVMATSYIRTAEKEYIIEPGDKSIISALDTTGAGDAFAAGFLYGLLKDKDIEQCGRLGDTVARFSIRKIGARDGLPTLDELSHRYHELYQREL
ncbi:MAG: carbohydrate kinase family protein [Dehalococcoidales bacterium]|nr:carbohydrate kinase family protein [Dehalococcoidales bacterium]